MIACSPPPAASPPPPPPANELPAGSATETVSAPVPAEPVSLTWKTTLAPWGWPRTSTVAASRTQRGGGGLELPTGDDDPAGGCAGLDDGGAGARVLRLAEAGTRAGAVTDPAGVADGSPSFAVASGDVAAPAVGLSGVLCPARDTPKTTPPTAITAAPLTASKRRGRAVSPAGRSREAAPAASSVVLTTGTSAVPGESRRVVPDR